MRRSDWLNIIQGLLLGMQPVNAFLAGEKQYLMGAAISSGLMAAGSYIVHSLAMDTPPDKKDGA